MINLEIKSVRYLLSHQVAYKEYLPVFISTVANQYRAKHMQNQNKQWIKLF